MSDIPEIFVWWLEKALKLKMEPATEFTMNDDPDAVVSQLNKLQSSVLRILEEHKVFDQTIPLLFGIIRTKV